MHTSTERQFIPLRNQAGRLLQPAADLAHILEHRNHFILKRNKRGHVTGAVVKRLSISPLTRMGECYTQPLPAGHRVYSLRGTPGAQGAPVIG